MRSLLLLVAIAGAHAFVAPALAPRGGLPAALGRGVSSCPGEEHKPAVTSGQALRCGCNGLSRSSLGWRKGAPSPACGGGMQERGGEGGADLSRRTVVGLGLALGLGQRAEAINYGSGTFSGVSAVNGVLSAYGLPQLPDQKGYTPFLGQYGPTVVEFVYPASWVINDRAKMRGRILRAGDTGITVSDYRTAEGLTLFSLPVSFASIDECPPSVIGDLVVDSGGSNAVAFKMKAQKALSEKGYKEFVFSWEQNTVSGYEIARVSVTAATVQKGVLYALSGVVSQERLKAMKPVLEEVAKSLRVYNV